MEEINKEEKVTEEKVVNEEVAKEEIVKEETNEEKVEDKIEENKNGSKTTEKDSKKEDVKSTNVVKETSKKPEKAKSQPNSTKSEEKNEIPVVNELKVTNHRFDPEDKVWVAEFRNVRDNAGFTKIENQFRFAPLEAVIEKVIITMESGVKTVRYKLKNKAGSMYDEEDVCVTYDEVVELCDARNK